MNKIHSNGSHAPVNPDHEHSHHHHSHSGVALDTSQNISCSQCGNSLCYCTCFVPDGEIQDRTYDLRNLDCANCGAKIESRLNKLPAVKSCSVSYPTKQMRVMAANQEAMLPELQAICQSVEPDVTVLPHTTASDAERTVVFDIKGLDCANCAAKIESRLNKVDGVDKAVVVYETGKLNVTAKHPERLLSALQEATDSVEDGVTISPQTAAKEPKTEEKENTRKEIYIIICGALIFALGWIFERYLSEPLELGIQIVAYLILGGNVLLTAFKNILKGNVFDENFLMAIATIGAFAIGDFHEGVGVMLFYRVGELFEDIAVDRSRSQIMEAVDLRPETVNLYENGKVTVIPAEQAVVGDIVEIRPGDRIPLDGVIVEGESRIDTSPVTGEPVPVHKGVNDEVVSGTVNTSGELKIKVEKPLKDSMVTRILDSVENAAANKPKMDRFITKFSKVYTPIVVGIALLVAIVPSLITGNWHHWLYTAITFLVISCPCALVLSVPLAFFCGIGAASKLGILFKGGNAIEAIEGVKAIVMDKTGTITEGNFKVQSANPCGVSPDELLTLAAECEVSSTHPIGVSIIQAAKERDLKLMRPDRIEEIAGKGIKADINGSTVLCGNKALLESQNVVVPKEITDNMGTEVLVAKDGKYVGDIVISDTIKPNAKEAIGKIRRHGLVTAMLTGDASNNANAVADKLGIDQVYAKLLPEQKLQKLRDIRDKDGAVMFIGDGINDAPVLAGADVGAAMGSGADAAIEAADVVFMTSDLDAIGEAYNIGKVTRKIAWENVYIALGVKVLIMALGLLGFANMWLAVFADTGVAMICILNSVRILRLGKKDEKKLEGALV